MKLSKLEKRILQDLFKASEGLYMFTVYQRYRLSPKDLFVSLESLKTKKLIVDEEDRMTISNEGKEFVIFNNLSSSDKKERFSRIPDEFIGRRININEFYFPKMKTFIRDFLFLENMEALETSIRK
jgi:hypothetical protein